MIVELNENDICLLRKVLSESAEKGDFMKGERGGEQFYNLANNYTLEDAKYYFASAIIGEKAKDKVYLKDWWKYQLPASRKKQFEKTYNQFESYRNGAQIKLFRGLVVKNDKEVDMNKAGECWSFSNAKARVWAEDIWDKIVYKHIMDDSELEMSRKIVFTASTELDNCRLPYSLWLAGRFERPEWEVRIKDETKVNIITKKEV